MKPTMRCHIENIPGTQSGLKLMLCTMLPLVVAVMPGSFKSPKESAGSSGDQIRKGLEPARDGSRNKELAILVPGLL